MVGWGLKRPTHPPKGIGLNKNKSLNKPVVVPINDNNRREATAFLLFGKIEAVVRKR